MKFSIIIPLSNQNADIERSVKSVKNQVNGQGLYEIIIVNSCNDKKALSRVENIEKCDPELVAVVNVPTEFSRPQMLNTGIEYCRCDYLLFLRAGDEVNSRLLEVANNHIDEYDPDIFSYGMTYAHERFDMFEDDPFNPEECRFVELADSESRKAFLMGDNVSDSYLCHIFSKKLIADVGVEFEDSVMDEDIVFSYPLFLFAQRVCYTKEHGYCAYCGDRETDIPRRIADRMVVQTRLFELLMGAEDLYAEYKDIIDAHFVREYFIGNLKLARGSKDVRELPLPTFEVMQYVTLNLVPKWIENDYLFSLNKDDRRLMLLVNRKFESAKDLNQYLKKDALISVITTTYNRSGQIKDSIECILRQSYQYFEYIIVDDCSTDDTERVVKSIDDPRIRYFKNEKNRGLCYSRNVGIKEACGRFIVCQDDDDFCRLDKLEKTINVFMSLSEEYGMVYCESINHSRRLSGITDIPAIIIPDRSMPDVRKKGYIFPALLSKNFITATAAMMRKDCMEKVGLYDESLFGYEDWDIYLRIAKEYEAAFIREPLYDYYQRSGTLISKKDDEHRRKIITALFDIDKKFVEDRKRYNIETSFKIVEQ